jgi:hypothetical protein
LRDNVKARILRPDGGHERLQPAEGEPRYRCQEELLTTRPDLTVGDADLARDGASPPVEPVVAQL